MHVRDPPARNSQMYVNDQQGDTQIHARDPHARTQSINGRERSTHARKRSTCLLYVCTCNPSKGKCIIVSLLTEWSSNTVVPAKCINVPVISCTTNRESFRELLLRLSFCSLNSQRRTNLSAHFIYGMNEVGGQTCAVEWRSTLRTLIYFTTLLRPMFGIL